MALRALIVDDEPLARERLRAMLEAEPAVEVVGLCANGREALDILRQELPEVMFLDVSMPEMDGFSLIEEMPAAALPLIVFVTASDKHAVGAFEAEAVDYLLKPFDRDRLRQTLRRTQARLQALRAVQLTGDLVALGERLRLAPDRIPVKENGRILFVNLDKVDWIGAADNYIELHVGKTSHLVLSTLTTFEARLPQEQFVRISRSTIVNLSRVREVHSHRHGDGKVVLQDGVTLSLSRGHRRRLDQLLGKGVGAAQRPRCASKGG